MRVSVSVGVGKCLRVHPRDSNRGAEEKKTRSSGSLMIQNSKLESASSYIAFFLPIRHLVTSQAFSTSTAMLVTSQAFSTSQGTSTANHNCE